MKSNLRVYIAGPLCLEEERNFLEKIDKLCKKYELSTFLPHRDCGLWEKTQDAKKIALGDLKGFDNCDFLIANLNGFNVGAGTAWEVGYAYAKGIPVIAIKSDRKLEDSREEISAIIFGTTKIVTSFEDLGVEIEKLIKRLS